MLVAGKLVLLCPRALQSRIKLGTLGSLGLRSPGRAQLNCGGAYNSVDAGSDPSACIAAPRGALVKNLENSG